MPIEAGPGVVIVDANSRPDRRAAANENGPGRMQLTLVSDIEKEGVILARAGESLMLSVNPSDTSDQNKEIDTYLGGYSPFGFIADLVSPVVLVDQEKARRRDFADDNVFEPVDTKTGRKGAINEIEHASNTTPYETEEHALAAFIPYAAETEAVKLYNVKAAHAKMISDKMGLSREVRVFDKLTDTTNWHADNRTTLVAGDKWNDGADKNPRFDLQARIEASASPVTGIVMNPTVLFWLLSDAEVRASMRQMMGDNAADQVLSRAAASQQIETVHLTGFPPITVAPAQKKVGGSRQYILGDDVLLLSQPGGGLPTDGSSIATCYTFRTKGRSGTGWTTNEYIPQGSHGLESGTMMESGYKETTFFASNISGGLIKDVLS